MIETAVPATENANGGASSFRAPADATGSIIKFTVPGIPTPWARAGGGSSVVRFTPAKQRSAMGVIKLIGSQAMAGARPLEGPVSLEVVAVYPWPASWSRKRRLEPAAKWKTSRPDVDNVCIKIVADALNGVCFLDDAQIAYVRASKVYGDFPGLTVRIGSL